MRLTEDDLRGAYEYLLKCRPFSKWGLPLSHKVRFKVIHSRMDMGRYDTDPFVIMASCRVIHNYYELLETVAHEMVHFVCEIKDLPDHLDHDKNFLRLAKQVCTAFGWKPETF